MATSNFETKKIVEKLQRLAEQNFKRDKAIPVIERGSEPWTAWRNFRARYGLSIEFMDECKRWTVPCIEPPMNLAELDEWLDIGKSAKQKRLAV